MRTRMRPAILVFLIVAVTILLIGCESMKIEQPTDYGALQDASDAHLAFERGDCKSVVRLTKPNRLRSWKPNEIRYSMLLLNAYCKELDGDIEAAREVYDEILATAPNSFSARDAEERSRILRILETDPARASWIASARQRALGNQASRAPVRRRPAFFPPLARTTGIEGYVVVEFGVTPQGKTSDPIVVESKPPFLFDGAAVRAIRAWEYARKPTASGDEFQVIRLVFRADHQESENGKVGGLGFDAGSDSKPGVNPGS